MATVTYIKERRQYLGAMRAVMRYCTREDKTWDALSQQHLVSGINCDGSSAILEFETTKAAYGKMDGINFYQYVQSFSPEERITHRQAHELAKAFAVRAWPDSEVLVTTHCDTQHIHSHFVINSVSFKDGRKLRQTPNTLKELRTLSDELCQAHSLAVLPQGQKESGKGMSAREYRSAARGESWKFRLINTIDECMKYASDREEFISLMESEGYTVRWERERKYITYTTPEGMKCRDSRLHEEKYCKEVMEHEFSIRAAEIAAGIEADKSTEYGTAACTHHTHRDPVSDGGGSSGADAAGERHVLGAANSAEVSSESEIRHRPGNSAELADRDTESVDADDLSAGTGWEAERAAYLQMAGVAAGFPHPHTAQMAGAGAGGDGSRAGDVVRHSGDHQQCAQYLPLTPLHGLAALGELLLSGDEDDEEEKRRMEAEREAQSLGAAIALAAGAVLALTDGQEEQTMDSL